MTEHMKELPDIRDVQVLNGNIIDIPTVTKKLAHDTALYVPAKILPALIGIVSVALFTRLFDPGAYGKYVMVSTTTNILIAIFSQWMFQSVLRFRSQYVHQNRNVAFNRNLYETLGLLTIFTIVIAGAGLLVKPMLGGYERFYYLSIFIVITGIWSNNLMAVLQADLKSLSLTVYTIIGAAMKVLVPALLIFLVARDIVFLVWGVLASFAFTLLPMVISVNRGPTELAAPASPGSSLADFLREFGAYGFPMIGWFLGAELLSISDRYFLQIFRGSNEVGIYSSNYNLVATAIAFVSMPLLTAAHPILMKAGNTVSGRKESIQSIITLFSRYFLILTVPIMVFISFLYKELTFIMLGDKFREGAIVMPIVLIGLTAWNFAMFGHKGLEFRNKTKIMFLYVLLCAAIKIALGIIFIPRYGYLAAAVTSLISFLAYPLLVYFGTRRDIRWRIPWLSVLRILTASVAPIILFMIVRITRIGIVPTILIDTILMAPLYALGLYLLKEFTTPELSFIAGMFHRIRPPAKGGDLRSG